MGIFEFVLGRRLGRNWTLRVQALAAASALGSVLALAVYLPHLVPSWKQDGVPFLISCAVMIGILSRPRDAMQVLAAGALLFLAALRWDHRDELRRFLVADSPVPEAVLEIVGTRRNIYWEGGVRFLWLKFRTRSYWACAQGSGAMFFRDAAEEYARRERLLQVLGTIDFFSRLLLPRIPGAKPARARSDRIDGGVYYCARARLHRACHRN
jgi:hypothetical protein